MGSGTGRRLVATVASLLALLALLACSTSDSTPGAVDAEPGDASTRKEIGPAAEVDATVTCEPQPVTSVPARPPHARRPSACTAEQIGGYWSSCVKNGDPACAAYRDANLLCFGCIESTSASTASGAITWFADYGFYFFNVGGCIALERGEPPSSGCGFAYQRYSECAALSCEQVCTYDTEAAFDEFGKCYRSAGGSTCGKYRAGYDVDCADIDVDPTIQVCFGEGRTDVEYFTDLAKVFCGGAAPDGGTDAGIDAADASDAAME
jgi:hypothetical protein